MPLIPVSDLVVGLYLGLLAGIFPAFIAFALGFSFKYFTDVTIPGFGVVVLAGALAGVSGGLLSLVDPELTGGWTGISAILVVLMASFWAHAQGDKLAAAMPRRVGSRLFDGARVSEGLAELVDSYGQVKIEPAGEVQDLEGYPPLTDEVRQEIETGSWRFPANLTPLEIEARLETRLVADHDLAEASVRLDRRGRAEIAAAPTSAGLSRRVPDGQRAVSVKTLLPTGMAKGDVATLELPDGDLTGTVVSARTDPSQVPPEGPEPSPEPTPDTPASAEDERLLPPPKAPTTTGGSGRVTLSVEADLARRILAVESTQIYVEPRGKQREYQVLEILKEAGTQFRKIQLPEDHPLAGQTLGAARIRERYDVAVLAIRRPTERLVAPTGRTELAARDILTVVGDPSAIDRFETEVAR